MTFCISVAVITKDWSSWLQHSVVTNAMPMFVDVHPKEGGNSSSEMMIITTKLHGIVTKKKSISPHNPN